MKLLYRLNVCQVVIDSIQNAEPIYRHKKQSLVFIDQTMKGRNRICLVICCWCWIVRKRRKTKFSIKDTTSEIHSTDFWFHGEILISPK
ncbi:hypothetical protein E2C01_062541 [Portunus trituberculatus]|uniref:Uncharacterized protein n=1 Tax=Portunus trituberculatus TaxID=210409 RepID=A0A5B7H6N5_PORTR|nr:hypothetical protein [Portunus trituberculatus]